jgi:DNA-binding NarL/FixJ family response regulator
VVDVVIAVQEPLVRGGLKAALDKSASTRVAAVVDTPEELESGLSRLGRAVVILDVRYRRADPELVPGIVRRHPDTGVLVMVAHNADECPVRDLLKAGNQTRLTPDALCKVDECCLMSLRNQAHGCLPREASGPEVVRAVEGVAAGELVAAPWLSMVNRSQLGGDPQEEIVAITSRELDVMGLLAEGLGNKAIARKLGIKEPTVKNHVARIMTKMGLSNRVQVAVAASGCHLIRVSEEA